MSSLGKDGGVPPQRNLASNFAAVGSRTIRAIVVHQLPNGSCLYDSFVCGLRFLGIDVTAVKLRFTLASWLVEH